MLAPPTKALEYWINAAFEFPLLPSLEEGIWIFHEYRVRVSTVASAGTDTQIIVILHELSLIVFTVTWSGAVKKGIGI